MRVLDQNGPLDDMPSGSLAEEIVAKDIPPGSNLKLVEHLVAKDFSPDSALTLVVMLSDAALNLAEEMVAKDLPDPLVKKVIMKTNVDHSFPWDDLPPGYVLPLVEHLPDLITFGTTLSSAEDRVAKDMPGLDQKDLGTLKNFAHGVEIIDLGMQEATNEKTTAGGPIFPTVAHGA